MLKTDLGNKKVFSENLEMYIAKSGIKKIDIAKRMGVSTGTVADWSKGRVYPRMDKIQKLAEIFGVEKSDLIESREYRDAEIRRLAQRIFDDAEFAKLVKTIDRLTPEERGAIDILLNKAGGNNE